MNDWSRRGFLKFLGITPAVKAFGIDLTGVKYEPEEVAEVITQETPITSGGVKLIIDGKDYSTLVQSISKPSYERHLIDVTCLGGRPDPDWFWDDSHGHRHSWDGNDLPTLEWVIDRPIHFDPEDGEEYPEEGHYACKICGELVEPGEIDDGYRNYSSGFSNAGKISVCLYADESIMQIEDKQVHECELQMEDTRMSFSAIFTEMNYEVPAPHNPILYNPILLNLEMQLTGPVTLENILTEEEKKQLEEKRKQEKRLHPERFCEHCDHEVSHGELMRCKNCGDRFCMACGDYYEQICYKCSDEDWEDEEEDY